MEGLSRYEQGCVRYKRYAESAYDCPCDCCLGVCCDEEPCQHPCSSHVHQLNHVEEDVPVLLRRSGAIAKLLVGPSKTELTCHKALLAFYSDFFDAALFRSFKEAEKAIVEMPEDDPDEIQAFITWVYTGSVDWGKEGISGFRLWVLGDKLLAAKFTNEAMTLVMGSLMEREISLLDVEYAYNNSRNDSKLSAFAKKVLYLESPLCPKQPPRKTDATPPTDSEQDDRDQKWKTLFRKGGQLLVDLLDVRGHHQASPEEEQCDWPWEASNADQYFEKESQKDAKTWRLGELERDTPAPPVNPAKRICR